MPGIDPQGVPISCSPSETCSDLVIELFVCVCVGGGCLACVYLSLVERGTLRATVSHLSKLVAGMGWKPGQNLVLPVREERLLWKMGALQGLELQG